MKAKSNLKILESLAVFDDLPNTANVRLPVVMGLYGVSAATVWRGVLNGHIPKPHKLTARTTVWNVGDLRKVLSKAQMIGVKS